MTSTGGPSGPSAPARPPKLLVVVAHPDDETFGCGGVIAHAAAAGAEVVVCSATRGELGEDHSGTTDGPGELGAARVAELEAAGRALGAARTSVLDLGDSGWDGPIPAGSLCGVDSSVVVAEVRRLLEAEVPDVVVTLDPTGSDGHRDHVRIAEATTAAVEAWVREGRPARTGVQATELHGARRGARATGGPDVHLYHWFLTRSLMHRWAEHMAAADPDSVYLQVELGHPDDDTTTILDTTAQVETIRRAIAEHRTQQSPYDGLPADLELAFLGTQHLQRVVPPWTGGPTETTIV
jgi:N-acetyl-1-D-myo-inositol-2-amino-2-deoxy-alpha-D-glucopyranoside deacetylase